MAMTRRDWWLGVGLVALAILLHAAFPRYEWRNVKGVPLVRIDRWTGRVVRGHYDENHAWQVYEDLVPIGAVVPQRTDPAAYGGVAVEAPDISPEAFGGVLVAAGKADTSPAKFGGVAVVDKPKAGIATFDDIAKKYGAVRVEPTARPPQTFSRDDIATIEPPARPPANPKAPHSDPLALRQTDQVLGKVKPARLTTGYEWQPASSTIGRGELNVTNGTTKEGVAVLFERLNDGSMRPRRAVYVRAREETRLHAIARGTYALRFMLGVDWNDNERVFRRGVECYAFVDALEFTETKTDDSVIYSEQSVTLHKVINGNARSTTISPAMIRFDELGRQQQP